MPLGPRQEKTSQPVARAAEASMPVAREEEVYSGKNGLETNQPGARADDKIDLEAGPPVSTNQDEITWDILVDMWQCKECEQEAKNILSEACMECEEGLDEDNMKMCILGLDLVALFPNLKSKNSGVRLRHQVMKGEINIKGFKWKKGARYIVINKRYTGPLGSLWHVLPYRRKVGGVAPGITAPEVSDPDGDENKQWQFKRTPTDLEIKEIAARCAEIATRVIWENFCYRFAGKTYRQSSGGPIGARVTMCVARLIMQDWGERYRELLVNASMRIALLNNYVDDVRQGCTLLKMGMRFNEEQMEFTWTLEAEIEDTEKREI